VTAMVSKFLLVYQMKFIVKAGYRVPIGQRKLQKVGEFVWSGKVRKGLRKISYFKVREKSEKMILDHEDCRYL